MYDSIKADMNNVCLSKYIIGIWLLLIIYTITVNV